MQSGERKAAMLEYLARERLKYSRLLTITEDTNHTVIEDRIRLLDDIADIVGRA